MSDIKSQGIIPIQEFLQPDGTVMSSPGTGNRSGAGTFRGHGGAHHSFPGAGTAPESWDQIEKAHNVQTILQGTVLEKTKGGVFVDIGVKAFLPGSQIDEYVAHSKPRQPQRASD